jgi:hypothetical protein
VIIPAHNEAANIRGAIDSVRAQGGAVARILVVADDCDDDTEAIARRQGVEVLTVAAHNPAVARNAALAESRADYVAFLDADDRWHPCWLAAALPGVAALRFGPARCIHPQGERPLPQRRGSGDVFDALLAGNFVCTSAVVAERSALVDGFCPALAPCEDWDLWLRVAHRHSIAQIATCPVAYRVRQGSAIRRDPGPLVAKELAVLGRAEALRPGAVTDAHRAAVYWRSAVRHLARNQGAAAQRDLLRGMALAPMHLEAAVLLGASVLPPRLLDLARRLRLCI